MLLSWTNNGKYRAELVSYKGNKPSVFVRFEDHAANEVVIGVSDSGEIRTSYGNLYKADIRIAGRTALMFSLKQYKELQTVIREAKDFLRRLKRQTNHVLNGKKTFCGLNVGSRTVTDVPGLATCKTCLMRQMRCQPPVQEVA